MISKGDLGTKYTSTNTLTITKSARGTGYFGSSFKDTLGASSVSVDSGCSTITVTDSSNYLNDEAGHAMSDFSDYRFITITKPNGSLYYASSLDFDDIEILNNILFYVRTELLSLCIRVIILTLFFQR